MSAKEIIGNRVQLTKWQDDFFKHMVKRFPNIDRGESASETGRRHIPTWLFKQGVNLSKQAARIQAEISSINPLNAGKKRETIAAMLDKFVPNYEKFEAYLRKYQREINALETENTDYEQQLDAAKPRVAAQLEAGKLQNEVTFLRDFYQSTLEEYKAAYKASKQKHLPQERL